MGLFDRKPTYCAICNKELKHKHKPKREWGIKGSLCGNCHVDKAQEFYEAKVRQPCIECGTKKKISDLWEPRWQWDMDGMQRSIKKKKVLNQRKTIVQCVAQK